MLITVYSKTPYLLFYTKDRNFLAFLLFLKTALKNPCVLHPGCFAILSKTVVQKNWLRKAPLSCQLSNLWSIISRFLTILATKPLCNAFHIYRLSQKVLTLSTKRFYTTLIFWKYPFDASCIATILYLCKIWAISLLPLNLLVKSF
jgi:hypothetical protein